MILKGNQRGGGQKLAAHLMNAFDNERVEVAEVRGAVAQDLSGAFAEWNAYTHGTKAKEALYSFSASPDPAQRQLTREEYYDILARTERSLNLVGQPRAVVFHVKEGREHVHAVWSRIDTEKMKAIQLSDDRLKLRTVARDFARDHGLELPDGLKKDRKKDRFDDRLKQENLAERQQKERNGIPKAQRMADIATCWRETGNGAAFVQALESKGYFIARGDQRAFVVIDLHGEVHSLSRQLAGVAKSKELSGRLASLPLDKLNDIAGAQDMARRAVEQAREKDRAQEHQQQEKEKEHDREEQIKERRARIFKWWLARQQELEQATFKALSEHLSERTALREMHDAENTGIVSARLARQPKGLLGFLRRITGIELMADRRAQRQDAERDAQQKQQMKSLQDKHDRELAELDRRKKWLKSLEARETRSMETALHREEFQQVARKIVEIDRKRVQPEFQRAAAPAVLQRTGTDDAKAPEKGKLVNLFTRFRDMLNPPEPTPEQPRVTPKEDFEQAAKPPVDLTAEFNREVEYRKQQEDRDRDIDPGRDFDPSDPTN